VSHVRCPCCHRNVPAVNHHGYCPDCAVCQHCDCRTAVRVAADGDKQLGLCRVCNRSKQFRELYRRKELADSCNGIPWTPEREQRVRTLTRQHQIAIIRREMC